MKIAKTIHDRINELISEGIRVESRAFGRIGRVVGVLNGQVIIQTSRGRSVTSFLCGDRTGLQKAGSRYEVVNVTQRFVRTFKPQFSPLVEAGTKRQTVRKTPVRMPNSGDLISLREWTGRPYNSPQRILRESVITKVEKITFFPTNDYMQIGCKYLSPEEAELFARYDGFDSRKSMLDWFKKTHGHEMFEGIVIYWE